MEPPLALGQVVHDCIDSLSKLPTSERFNEPIADRFEKMWQNVSGVKGGFADFEQEQKYHDRARAMIERVAKHPGPIAQKAIKIRQDLPYFWLSEEDSIILCGKVDWLEYIDLSDSVRIIDFKTGKFDEDPESLQLPIYYLLASRTQTKKVSAMAYWYLDRDNDPQDVPLPNEEEAYKRVLEIAKKVSLARKLGHFKCKTDGCRSCRPYEAIVNGKAIHIGINTFGQDLYVLEQTSVS
jgi:ATP-dependent helicase/DNAse subunit B